MALIDELREELHALDDQLIAAAARRIDIARRIGQTKRDAGLPTVDYAQEARVMRRARDLGRDHGISADLAEDLLHRLIEESVLAQEDDRLRTDDHAGRTAVVYGGAGRMGRWLVGFLAAQGMHVEVHDPDAGARSPAVLAGRGRPQSDYVFMATPPAVTATVYESWLEAPPPGILCDIASIKSPFAAAVEALSEAGARVTSLHPMFGPNAKMLRDHDVVICPCADAESDEAVAALFYNTSARLLSVPFDAHDQWMADALALAHATVLIFGNALPEDPVPVRSQTLAALLDIADQVSEESPDVYFEIQAHNPNTLGSLARLRDSVEAFQDIVHRMDRAAFGELMRTARDRVDASLEAAEA